MKLWHILILAIPFGTSVIGAPTAETTLFEAKVRPILAARCYSCHSATAKPRFAGLSLDSAAGLLRGSDAGPILSPGHPGQSKLIQAILGELKMTMPPTGKLSPDEIAVLVKWVESGAELPKDAVETKASATFDLERRKREHWAWQPVRKPDLPSVQDSKWARRPVDSFLLATLERERLTPAPPADRRTLLRRLTFDLTGLPPSPEELEQFAKDGAPDAYEKQVDRMLASPRFGEHWARHWMDLVRYCESHGSEGDPDIPMAWRYRDYLIRALNADVPYDQLVREHLAGDLLPNPRINPVEHINESLLGVAHLRMVEHGFQPVDPWEDRIKWTDNQIDVVSKAFQGLTVSCARCHDHKFDAISQKDYYALFGVLASARPTQAAIDWPAEPSSIRAELIETKQELRSGIAAEWGRPIDELPKWLRDRPAPQRVSLESPLDLWLAVRDKKGEEFRQAWTEISSQVHEESGRRAETNARNFKVLWDLTGSNYSGWLERGTGITARPSPPGEFSLLPSGNRLLDGLYPAGVYTNLLSSKQNGLLQSPRFRVDSDYLSIRMAGGNGGAAQLIIENYAVPRGGIYELRAIPKQAGMQWIRISTAFWKGFTAYVEFATAGDATIFTPDKKAPASETGRSWFGAQAVYTHNQKELPKDQPLAALHALDGGSPTSSDDLASIYQKLMLAAMDAWQRNQMSSAQAAFLDAFLQAGFLPVELERMPRLGSVTARYRADEARLAIPRYAPSVLQEPTRPQPLLIRGDARRPGEPVPPRFLQALGGPSYTDPQRARLELADAIADKSNPLTARVMVNRIWKYLFGAGLVRTVDNFGKLGETPSHPELLDWLADRFVSDGWSMKKTIRMLVTTQAYRMSSSASPEALERDPDNRWLQHASVRRLEAEAIRDSILSVSGELRLDMYGPSVRTYYAHETGRTKGDRPKGPLDGDGRRSVYLEVRRNVTNPVLEAFDVPVISSTRGQRDLTNVPAQSLVLLNDPFIIEQAGRWAARIVPAVPASDRLRTMFLRVLGREPTPQENSAAAGLLQAAEAEHTGAADAERLVCSELAHSLFNLKEFLYIR